MAPCAVPKSVRNPPDVASITAADRHAKDDCGEAVPETQAMQHLQTAYIRKQHGTVDASTTECGNFGTLVQMGQPARRKTIAWASRRCLRPRARRRRTACS